MEAPTEISVSEVVPETTVAPEQVEMMSQEGEVRGETCHGEGGGPAKSPMQEEDGPAGGECPLDALLGSDCRFRLEAVADSVMSVLSSEQLQLRLLQDWVIFSRQEFDFCLKGVSGSALSEPFQVVSLLFHLGTGRYLVRVWHATKSSGVVTDLGELEGALYEAFHGTVPCLGVEARFLEETFDTRQLPMAGPKRLVADNCELLVRQEDLSQVEVSAAAKTGLCLACRTLLSEEAAKVEERERLAAVVGASASEGTKESASEELAPKRRRTNVDGAELKSNQQCKYCLEVFTSNQTRYLHERDVHLSGRFNCQVCGQHCSNVPELVQHFNSGHPDSGSLKCPICERAEWPDLVEHYKGCLEVKKAKLAKGEYKRKKKGKEEIKCHYCGKTFRKKCDLTNHYRSHNGEKLTCPECDFQSHSVHTIYTHRKSHARARGEEKVSHFCDHCGQNFTTRNYLQKHVRYAHDNLSDNIKCEFCGEVFERQHTYNRHKNKEHSDDPRFACRECGARFGSESEVKKHSWSHSDAPRLFCDLCGKGLKTQKSMKAHMRAHRGEKPYKCDICNDYTCVSSSALSLHKRFKHRGGEPMAISKANGRA